MERIRDYTVIDLEMTGLAATRDRVIEVGAMRVRQGQPRQELSFLVDPGMPLPERVTALTGITEEMVRQGLPYDEGLERLLDFLGEDVLVGQNLYFDYSFLAQWCINRKRTYQPRGIDTLKLARLLLPETQSKKLEDLCRYFGIERTNAHRALEDARETGQVLERLYELAGAGEGETREKAEKLLCPAPLVYKGKKQTPATPAQLQQLRTYYSRHGLTESICFEGMTRGEASRKLDQWYAMYGRN